MRAYVDRIRPLRCQSGTEFARLNAAARRQVTEHLIDELAGLAQSMASLEGRKAIVLLSEGLYMDSDIRHAWREFLSVANKHRVIVYAIHLDFPLTEAGLAGNTTTTRLLDDQYGFDGMAEAAASAGGTAFRAIATASASLRILDTELSGYYLLSFRRDRSDEPGKQIKIVVKVKSSGFDVRSRQSVVPGPFIK
jgi:VWFA-related protein